MQPRVAIVGGGIAGLACAHALRGRARVTLFEAAPRLGGHVHAVEVPGVGTVEAGFLAFHRSRYPRLSALLDGFGVGTAPSGTGLAVNAPHVGLRKQDWLAHPAIRPDLMATFRLIRRHERDPIAHPFPNVRLDAWLLEREMGLAFPEFVVIPSIAALWGFQPTEIMAMSAAAVLRMLARFMGEAHDEPFLRIAPSTRPWLDALAGSLDAEIRRATPVRAVGPDAAVDGEAFDHVVLATHADRALALLAAPTAAQAATLGAVTYRETVAIVHDDAAFLPPVRDDYTYALRDRVATVTWDMARLQGVPLFVTTAPVGFAGVDPARVHHVATWRHPAMTPEALAAPVAALNDGGPLWFCGSYFDETGSNEAAIAAGQAVAERLRAGR